MCHGCCTIHYVIALKLYRERRTCTQCGVEAFSLGDLTNLIYTHSAGRYWFFTNRFNIKMHPLLRKSFFHRKQMEKRKGQYYFKGCLQHPSYCIANCILRVASKETVMFALEQYGMKNTTFTAIGFGKFIVFFSPNSYAVSNLWNLRKKYVYSNDKTV